MHNSQCVMLDFESQITHIDFNIMASDNKKVCHNRQTYPYMSAFCVSQDSFKGHHLSVSLPQKNLKVKPKR